MSVETSKFEGNKEVEPGDFKREMAMMEATLQNLVDGESVAYERDMKLVEAQLRSMEAKYKGNQKIAKFLDAYSTKFAFVAGVLGGLLASLVAPENLPLAGSTIGSIGAVGTFTSLKMMADGIGDLKSIKAREALSSMQELMKMGREFTDDYLKRGGAISVEDKGVKDSRLHVTDEQVEKARAEMNKDLTSGGK